MKNSQKKIGKNPNIIFDDANLEDCVATTVRSSFSNQGNAHGQDF